MTNRESLTSFVKSVANIRADRRLRVFRANVFEAARVPPTYDNPLGSLSADVEKGLYEQVERARDSFRKSEEEAVWNKLFIFLLEE